MGDETLVPVVVEGIIEVLSFSAALPMTETLVCWKLIHVC